MNDLVLDLSKVYATTTPGAYPILLASYEIVCSKYPDADVGKAVKAFMQSTITEGQEGLPRSDTSHCRPTSRPRLPPPSTASADTSGERPDPYPLAAKKNASISANIT